MTEEQEVLAPELPPEGEVDGPPETARQAAVITEVATELKEDGHGTSAPDILYRVRMGKVNEPLRYSLRSLAHLPHGEVFIVGYAPPWIDREQVTVLEGAKTTIKWRAGPEQFRRGVEQLRGRKLLLVDDDMFVLRKMDEVPVYHAGPLRDHAAGKLGAYGRTFSNTVEYLEEQGIADPLSYERHIPLPVDADAAAEALDHAVEWMRKHGTVQGRSVYGNMAHIGGEERSDVKAKVGTELPPDFLSVDERTWSHGWAKVILRMFPSRSRYELK